jgi:hypothetical protein
MPISRPTPGTADDAEEAARYALGSWPRTARLCLIYLARGAPAAGTAITWYLIVRH